MEKDFDVNDLAKEALEKLKQENGEAAKDTEDEDGTEDYSEFYDEIQKEVEDEEGNIYEDEDKGEKKDELSEIKVNHDPTEEYYENEMNVPYEYEDEIYPGGPSENDINMWKKEYGENAINLVTVKDEKFVVRALNRYEHKQITAMEINALQREELICQTVTLYPMGYNWRDMATGKAGTPSTLCAMIMEISAFTKDIMIEVL